MYEINSKIFFLADFFFEGGGSIDDLDKYIHFSLADMFFLAVISD